MYGKQKTAELHAHFKRVFACDDKTADLLVDSHESAYEMGRKAGQAEAQRFFRLALGVEQATPREAALWSNPVPLKEE